jgi:hypothetical protein
MAEAVGLPGALEASVRIAVAAAAPDAAATAGIAWFNKLHVKVPQVVTAPSKLVPSEDGSGDVPAITNALKLVPKLSCWPPGPDGSQLVVPGSPLPLPASFELLDHTPGAGEGQGAATSTTAYLNAIAALLHPLVSVVGLRPPFASEGEGPGRQAWH